MKRLIGAMFMSALVLAAAPSAWADKGDRHDKHWKQWEKMEKHDRKAWEKQRRHEARHGYYEPVFVQPAPPVYYQPAPVVVYQPQPVYRPYYYSEPSVNLNVRIPLN